MSRLDLDLILRRTGWGPWVAAALIAAAVAIQVLGTTQLRTKIDARQQEFDRLHALDTKPQAAAEPERPLIE